MNIETTLCIDFDLTKGTCTVICSNKDFNNSLIIGFILIMN